MPGEIRHEVTQHDQTELTLDDIYQIVTTAQREAGTKIWKTVTAVEEDSESDEDNYDVATFQNRKSSKGNAKKWKNSVSASGCNNYG